MPAYSFKERFVPMVKEGSKRQTIRVFRKTPPRVGQLAHLYYGMRTKFCTKLVTPSPRIEAIACVLITACGDVLIIKKDFLTHAERAHVLVATVAAIRRKYECDYYWTDYDKDRFAWADGFRHADDPENYIGCFAIMLRWWQQTHELPFVGNLIKWEKP